MSVHDTDPFSGESSATCMMEPISVGHNTACHLVTQLMPEALYTHLCEYPPLWIPTSVDTQRTPGNNKNWQELMNRHPTHKFLVMAGSEYWRVEIATTQHMADATKASWRLLGRLAGSLKTTD